MKLITSTLVPTSPSPRWHRCSCRPRPRRPPPATAAPSIRSARSRPAPSRLEHPRVDYKIRVACNGGRHPGPVVPVGGGHLRSRGETSTTSPATRSTPSTSPAGPASRRRGAVPCPRPRTTAPSRRSSRRCGSGCPPRPAPRLDPFEARLRRDPPLDTPGAHGRAGITARPSCSSLHALSPSRQPSRVLIVAAAGYGKSASLEPHLATAWPASVARPSCCDRSPATSTLPARDRRPPRARSPRSSRRCWTPLADPPGGARRHHRFPHPARPGRPGSARRRDPRARSRATSRSRRTDVRPRCSPTSTACTTPSAACAGARAHRRLAGAGALRRRPPWPAHPDERPVEALTRPRSARRDLAGSRRCSTSCPACVTCSARRELGRSPRRLCDRLLAGAAWPPTVSRSCRRTGLLVPRRRLERVELLLVPRGGRVLAVGRRSPGRRATPAPSAIAALLRGRRAGAAGRPGVRPGPASTATSKRLLLRRRASRCSGRATPPRVVDLLAAACRPDAACTGGLQLTYADALRMSGDPSPAPRAACRPLVEQADRTGWTAGLAEPGGGGRTTCAAILQAALDALRPRRRGRTCRRTRSGSRVARLPRPRPRLPRPRRRGRASWPPRRWPRPSATGGPRALAAAHLAMARASTGPARRRTTSRPCGRRRRPATSSTAARILVNHSCLLLAAARYAEAVQRCPRGACRLAEIGQPTGRYAAALHNLGRGPDPRRGVRRGDVAAAARRRPVPAARRRTGASGLLGLAEIHRELGHDEQSPGRATRRPSELARAAERGAGARAGPRRAGPACQLDRRPTPRWPRPRRRSGSRPPALLPFALHALAAGWPWPAASRRRRRGVADRGRRRGARGAGLRPAGRGARADRPARHRRSRDARRALTEALRDLAGRAAPCRRRRGSRCCSAGSTTPTAPRGPGRGTPPDGCSGWASCSVQRSPARRGRPPALPGRRPGARRLRGQRRRRARCRCPPGAPGRPGRWSRSSPPAAAAGHPGLAVRAALARRRPGEDRPPALGAAGHRPRRARPRARPGRPDHYVAADLRGIWLDLRHVDLDAEPLLARRRRWPPS